VKTRAPASTHKKVVVVLREGVPVRGYLNPSSLGRIEKLNLLTPDGEHLSVPLEEVKCVYFVREFSESYEPERKAFYSRPKLDGLWVKLKFYDGDFLEGIVSSDLLDLLENGVQLTPPDLHGNSLRLFIPRSALAEMKVLGVVGVARRAPREGPPAVAAGQSKLFTE
jgi:hypothetical protein